MELKFLLQIFCVPHTDYDHVIDLQLTQGHPMVFFNVSNLLYNMI